MLRHAQVGGREGIEEGIRRRNQEAEWIGRDNVRWVEKSHSGEQGEEATHKIHDAHNAPTEHPQSTEMVSWLRDFCAYCGLDLRAQVSDAHCSPFYSLHPHSGR